VLRRRIPSFQLPINYQLCLSDCQEFQPSRRLSDSNTVADRELPNPNIFALRLALNAKFNSPMPHLFQALRFPCVGTLRPAADGWHVQFVPT